MEVQYKVLYTHQKLKKKKIWQDGYLKVSPNNRKANLLNDSWQNIDSLFVRDYKLCDDTELESDKFLITVECEHLNDQHRSNSGNSSNKENACVNNSQKQGEEKCVRQSSENEPFCPVFSSRAKQAAFKAELKYDSSRHPNESSAENSGLLPDSYERLKKRLCTPKQSPFFSYDQPAGNLRQVNLTMDNIVQSYHQGESPNFRNFDVDCMKLADKVTDVNLLCEKNNESFFSHNSVRVTKKRSTNELLDLFNSTSTMRSTNVDDKEFKKGSLIRIDVSRYCTGTNSNEPCSDSLAQTRPSCTDVHDKYCGSDVAKRNEKALKRKHVLPTHVIAETFQTFERPATKIQNVGDHAGSSMVERSERTVFTPLSASQPNSTLLTQSSPRNVLTRNSNFYKTSSYTPPQFSKQEYNFPTKEECTENPTPKREIKIPFTFDSAARYKQTFKSIIKEHLNIILFDVASKYFSAMTSVDMSSFQIGSGFNDSSVGTNVACKHGPAKLKVVRKEGRNAGRMFYSCPGVATANCNYFKWADDVVRSSPAATSNNPQLTSKIVLTDHQSISSYFNTRGVQLYCDVKITRKSPYYNVKIKGRSKAKITATVSNIKKVLILVLPFKKASSFYAKDDIWIVSKTLEFQPRSTFIARSVFYGPNSSGDLEILPLAGYSISNWQNNESCVCIQACNASSELICIQNLNDYVNPMDVPVLSSLLSYPLLSNVNNLCNRLNLSCLQVGDTKEFLNNTISKFSLNEDQATALCRIADMFVEEKNNCITLIHGVFGAGKSYLLAIVVLFLVELFGIMETKFKLSKKLKLLIASTTNVAVDRVLQTLLNLGYQDFVRVGSVKKIAKPILPYSVHASDREDQELKELNDLAKTDLTDEEKGYIRKAIELHKLGVNRKKLNDVAVVGVTCAACVFPYLQSLTFQVQLLDECSQITEPTSMLPIARFKCERLVLVGDPKQLSPTISGSEAKHSVSLEMTMFERLQHVGYDSVILRTQYRCHPSISELCNKMFYDGVLLNGVSENDREPLLDWLPTVGFCDVHTGKEQCQSDGSFLNLEEAKFIVDLLVCIMRSGIESTQVGVITQYKSQVCKIKSLLHESNVANADVKALQISTVDAFQGAEKEIVLLSCVRTRNIGFIDCPQRTNVALSRAKRHLLVVGNKKLLSSDQCWGGVLDVCSKQKTAVVERTQYFLQCALEGCANCE